MRIQGGDGTNPPSAEFNQGLWLTGPPEMNESFYGNLDYRGGLMFVDSLQGDSSDYTIRYSGFNGQALNLTETMPGESNTTTFYAGSARFTSTAPNTVPGVTDIDGGVVTADTVIAGEVRTRKWRIPPADYVFEPGYEAKSLDEVERYVRSHKHLPDIPSGKELMRDGMAMGEMQLRLVKTVEEMTLNMIALNKEVQAQKAANAKLQDEIRTLKQGREGAGR
jgi:hypothetical protein